MRTEIVVDSRGRPCPLPVIDLARAIVGVEVGTVLRVLADDPGAANDIAAWCRMRGQALDDTSDQGDHQVFLVRRII